MTSLNAASADPEPRVPSPAQDSRPANGIQKSRVLIWVLLLGLGLLAGIAAWLVGERTMVYTRPSLAASENYRDSGPLNIEMLHVTAINGSLTFGALGALLGLAMGLGGGLSSGSAKSAISGAVVGLVLGAAAGALPSLVVMPWQWSHRNDDPANVELMMPLMIHFALWSLAGLAAGLAFGVGSSGFKPFRLFEAALAGLIGAMLGTFVYELAGASLFPFAQTTDPFSQTSGSRLFARLCVAGFVSLGMIRALPRSKSPKLDSKGNDIS
jgi:hypothetical protein